MNAVKLVYEVVEMPVTSARKGMRNLTRGWRRRYREFSYGKDQNQRVILYEPREVKHDTVVLYFHGGGFLVGTPDSMGYTADVFCSQGYRFLSLGYRLIEKYPFPAQVEDAFRGYAVAMKILEMIGVGDVPVVVGGNSAGGTLAALLAYGRNLSAGYGIDTRKIRGVISLAGVMDMRDFLSKLAGNPLLGRLTTLDTPEAFLRYSPMDLIDRESTAKYLAIHGREDQMSPYRSQVRFVERLNALEEERNGRKEDLDWRYDRQAMERDQATLYTLHGWKYQHIRLTAGLFTERRKNNRPLHYLFRWLSSFDTGSDAAGPADIPGDSSGIPPEDEDPEIRRARIRKNKERLAQIDKMRRAMAAADVPDGDPAGTRVSRPAHDDHDQPGKENRAVSEEEMCDRSTRRR